MKRSIGGLVLVFVFALCLLITVYAEHGEGSKLLSTGLVPVGTPDLEPLTPPPIPTQTEIPELNVKNVIGDTGLLVLFITAIVVIVIIMVIVVRNKDVI